MPHAAQLHTTYHATHRACLELPLPTSMGVFEAFFVASVLVAMLGLLFVGWKTPEVVVRVDLSRLQEQHPVSAQ